MFEKLGDLKNMGAMMKQAMEMKSRMEALKESLGDERIEATSGGGMVKVVFSGKLELLSLEIDPEVMEGGDKEVLETLIKAAVNEGVLRAQEMVKLKMTELTYGIDLPGITS